MLKYLTISNKCVFRTIHTIAGVSPYLPFNHHCNRKSFNNNYSSVARVGLKFESNTLTLPHAHPCIFSSNQHSHSLKYSISQKPAPITRQFTTWNKMIVYSRICPTESPIIAKHLLESFFKQEPFGLALGLTLDQVEPWYHKFLDQVLNYYEPVSFMAKDTDTNEVVGVAINIIMDLDDKSRQPPPGMKPYLDKTKQPVKWQIATFLEDLEEGVDVVKELKMDASKPNKMFVCLFLSVLPEYGGKGLAKTLIRESEQEAKQIEGVTIAMTDVTSFFSYMAFQKLGYQCVKEVQYLSYKDPDGIPIFEGRDKQLGIHTHARVMAKPI